LTKCEKTLKRIQGQKGVLGIIVVNSEGIPIKSTMDNGSTLQYASLMHQLVMKARSSVRDIDCQNDLTFLRIRSKKNEIMVAPGNGGSCVLMIRFIQLRQPWRRHRRDLLNVIPDVAKQVRACVC
uniref:Dynein light chain roadblock-type 1 n=1 Tax=Leptobrachium leishanense TaxID=445787 RepID=A0A8C5QN22_9ANUR